MAWAAVGSGVISFEKVNDTSFTVTGTGVVPTAAGQSLVLVICTDNAGDSIPTFTISKPAGETNSWVQAARQNSVNNSAGASTVGSIFVITSTVDWAGHSPVITLSNAVSAKTAVMRRFSGGSSLIRGPAVLTQNLSGTFTLGAIPSSPSNAPVAGDLVIGLMANEHTTSPADPSGSGWVNLATGVQTTGGGAASNVTLFSFYKIATVSGNENFEPSDQVILGDGSLVAVALQPAGVPGQSGVGTATFGGTFTASGLPRVLGAAVAALGFTGIASGAPLTTSVAGVGVPL